MVKVMGDVCRIMDTSGEITSGSIHEPSPGRGAAGRGKNLAVSPELLLAAAGAGWLCVVSSHLFTRRDTSAAQPRPRAGVQSGVWSVVVGKLLINQ